MKKVLYVLLGVLMVFSLTGCKNKTVLTIDEFNQKSENYGCNIQELNSGSLEENTVIDYSLVRCLNQWNVYFFKFESTTAAENKYKEYEEIIDSSDSSVKTKINIKNYSTYSAQNGNSYIYISRVDDTLMQIETNAKYKDDVKDYAKKLGY